MHVFIDGGGIRSTLFFPDDISFSEMLKIIFFTFGLDQSSLINRNLIVYAEKNLLLRDKFKYYIKNEIRFSDNVLGGIQTCFGKDIKAEIFEKGKNYSLNTINIGLLNSNKHLINRIRIYLCLDNDKKKINKITIDGKEIDIKEEKSLLSLGIKDDFSCKIELIGI